MQTSKAPAWVVPVMRLGYSARAATYSIVGALALSAAIWGGVAEGTEGAIGSLQGAPFGIVLIWIVALGLFCYSVWRFVAAALDLERRGDDASGLFARGGLLVTGALHAFLGASALDLVPESDEAGGSWTQDVLALPFGRWLLLALAIAVFGAGLYYIYKGWTEAYKKHIRVTPLTERLKPVLRIGIVSEGVLIGVIGGLLALSALTYDADNSGSMGDALREIGAAPYGRVLLGFAGLGLLAFAVENVIEARFRVLPARDGPDVETLASRAMQKAKAQT
ncbi:hypothetical protein FIU97_10615 [Roseivivax sp. THAF40]|uniref:DUF1206 domain-containing protein n=1 Tax=unclassified Roseivivax TaxID=2639302 RepID=UPI0012681A2F|nr:MULTISPECIES: DUF1206 domain-containing protein [unclassified Roseivivax]QFS83280.1 hypothetical protein FIV09_10630 [Roseivivax sp. THAF197b]QFT47024.1 hypothetical protein FIU97_10615 [Roseivivax sp. THAF40]